LDTASEITRDLKIPLESSNNWRETNNGLIAGMPNEIVNERYPGLSFSGLRMDERYPGGESPLEFYTRIKETLTLLFEEQASKNHAENVLIVTHRGVINVIYHLVRGLEWTNHSNRNFPVSYTSIHRLDYQAGQWIFTIENLTEHL
jgi:probable phosphoglycerate mutase